MLITYHYLFFYVELERLWGEGNKKNYVETLLEDFPRSGSSHFLHGMAEFSLSGFSFKCKITFFILISVEFD